MDKSLSGEFHGLEVEVDLADGGDGGVVSGRCGGILRCARPSADGKAHSGWIARLADPLRLEQMLAD
jgi:hypothetical protein